MHAELLIVEPVEGEIADSWAGGGAVGLAVPVTGDGNGVECDVCDVGDGYIGWKDGLGSGSCWNWRAADEKRGTKKQDLGSLHDDVESQTTVMYSV